MKYELAMLFKPLSNEEIKDKYINKIAELIKASEGQVTKADYWGKRIIAYKMKKHKEGSYVFLKVSLPKSKALDLDKMVKFMPDVLRYMRVSI